MRTEQKRFYKKYLKTLQWGKGNPRETKHLIQNAPVPVLKLLSNAAIVASRGNIKLTNKDRRRFRSRKDIFRVLTNKGINFDKKRHYLIQHGGGAFIPILLSSIIPLVGDLLFRALSK